MAKANSPVGTYHAIIGTGQGGPRLVAAGMTVGIIERGAFGGTCVQHRMRSNQDIGRQRLWCAAPLLQQTTPIHPTVAELLPTLLDDLRPL